MDGRDGIRASSRFIGVAGRCANDEEKSYVKQAVFLLRYRMRFADPDAELAPRGAPESE